uniref:hypothetical protein n=1 Tax=Alistipes sp. TaxID=1872444 RepID=UPI0040576834
MPLTDAAEREQRVLAHYSAEPRRSEDEGQVGVGDTKGGGNFYHHYIKNKGIIKGFQPPWGKTILFEKEKVQLALQENREFEKMLTRARKSKQRCV